MNYVLENWSFDPILIAVVLTVVVHEIGLARLRAHSMPSRNHRRRVNSLLFYAGLAVLLIATVSPIDYWASKYFFVHMIEHILLAFFAPILIVAGAPWIPLMFFLPVRQRRSVGRFFFLSPSARPLRSIGRLIRNPWVALISFNATMLLWHIPSWFEYSERNAAVHIWLMHGSFIVTGILFWLQIIPSRPMKPARGPIWQGGSILATNAIMTVMAISMSMLTNVSWYSNYSHVPGVTLSPFADQQIGAAILWVCGDFWALPALNLIVRRAIQSDGSVANVVDRLTHRGAMPSAEAFQAARAKRLSKDDVGQLTTDP